MCTIHEMLHRSFEWALEHLMKGLVALDVRPFKDILDSLSGLVPFTWMLYRLSRCWTAWMDMLDHLKEILDRMSECCTVHGHVWAFKWMLDSIRYSNTRCLIGLIMSFGWWIIVLHSRSGKLTIKYVLTDSLFP